MGVSESLLEKVLLEKAVIEILDISQRDKEIAIQDCVDANGGSKDAVDYNMLLASYKSTSVENMLKKQANKAKMEAQKAKRLAEAAAGNALTAAEEYDEATRAYAGTDAVIEKAVRRRFKVQFNPSTLSINGYGGGMAQITNLSRDRKGKGDKKDSSGGITYEEAGTHIEMSVQLIFDNSNHLTAFPGDIYGMNVSNALGAAGGAAAKKLLGKRPSIQEEVEGFLGMLRSQYTRAVSFVWGSMAYTGVCNSVGAKYTLFNPSGEPIRAQVNFRMICADESVSKGQMGYWKDMYKTFTESDIKYESYENNWLNLKG